MQARRDAQRWTIAIASRFLNAELPRMSHGAGVRYAPRCSASTTETPSFLLCDAFPMKLGTVQGLRRFPVKSMAGETLDSAPISTRGIPGDRGWAVYDETRGGVTNAKWNPLLRACRARYTRPPITDAEPPPVEITLPDGNVVRSSDANTARLLSEFLGRRVSLRSLGPPGSKGAPRVTAQGASADAIRELMGLEPGEPMADMSELTPERMHAMRDGNFFDALPMHLLTDVTLRTLAGIAPATAWDEQRFRPNILVSSTAAGGYPEFEWIGRRVRVGAATIEVAMACPRCVMATQATDQLPKDPQVMRTLVKATRHRAGVYARVVYPGEVRPGDELRLVEMPHGD
jgi:uncharacterized protein YcbX